MRSDPEEETWCWWPVLGRKYKTHWKKYKATVLRRHKNGTADVRYSDGAVETDVEVRLLVAGAVLHLTAISTGSAAG